MDTAVDGIITLDDAGVVESMNPAAERIFGYATDAVIGRDVEMLLPDPGRPEYDSGLSSYLRTGAPPIIGAIREVHGRRKDGTVFPMELAVSESHFDSRRLFTGIVRDITEYKGAVAERTRLLGELEAERGPAQHPARQRPDRFRLLRPRAALRPAQPGPGRVQRLAG